MTRNIRAVVLNGVFVICMLGCSPAPLAPGTILPATTIPSTPSATATPSASGLWVAASLPDELRAAALAANLSPASDPASAAARLDIATGSQTADPGSTWIYALVAPFPTVTDGMGFTDLEQAWAGHAPAAFADRPLVMTQPTYEAMKAVFGDGASAGAVDIVAANAVDDALWQGGAQWGIVPFEALDPKLKVLQIDGRSPLHKDFDTAAYPLKVIFSLQPASIALPATNRDPSKMTTVMMTGTSALVRAIASKMEQNGVLYPDGDIRDMLRQADVLHISNEVSFADTCPPPIYDTHDLRFCSNPKYIRLFEDAGVDIVEVTGNHINNWDVGPLRDTLQMYKDRGWQYFGGGMNLEDAERPALMEHNGTKLAFIGCNEAGPEPAIATATLPGAAPCGDYGWILAAIHSLRAQGYQVIVTQQYDEYYVAKPTENQARDFNHLAAAGATVVSGSQAHYPQTMAFINGAFVHYGLGNLFFDQMSYQYPDTGQFTYTTRDGFLDQHVFYAGRYISTELYTVILEDHSRPRPMTSDERAAFLQEYFTESGW